MSTELDRIELGRLASFRGFFDRPDRSEQSPAWYLRPRLLWLPTLLIVGLGAGVLWFDSDDGSAEGEPFALEIDAPASPAAVATVSPQPASSQPASSPDRPAATTDAAPQASDVPPVNGLSISSQSWRRGGLGSKALVTFTLRNNNDYAVRDIEVACAFARRDGSHLTDRKRVIADTVNMKSRKTFARMLVGFVNVNASRAKCAPVAANRS
jgi:hypothetical protein